MIRIFPAIVSGAILSILAFLSATFPTASADEEAAHSSATDTIHYVNPRFGFSISYPRALFGPCSESDNGDGCIARSLDGRATLRVWGSNSPAVFNESLAGLYIKESKLPQRRVTYSTLNAKEGFFVVSGYKNATIFYIKTYVLDGVQSTLEIEYDRGARDPHDSVTGRLAASFHPSKPQD
jgi:hypothetical protein